MTNIIKGTFGPRPQAGNPAPGDPKQPSPPVYTENKPAPEVEDLERPGVRVDTKELPEQIVKALGIIRASVEGHMSFIVIGIKPTGGGADFYTALFGDHDELRNAEDHLQGAIGRLYAREGVR
jgi:hypothetical protein